MDKVQTFQTFAQKIGYNIDDFVKIYAGQFFPQTQIEKSETFLNIIGNNLTGDQEKYINQICNLPNRDSRTPVEYARDLVISWMVEDMICDYLQLESNGADAQRNFLKKGQIKYDSDFKYKDRFLELYVNFTNYWTKTRKIDLRMDKHSHLVKNKSILLGIAFESCQFFIIDFAKEKIPFYENYNYFWKKKCYTCDKYDKFYDVSELNNYLSYFG